MGQERFTSLALLNIETDLTASLVPEDLVQMYASSGTRRRPATAVADIVLCVCVYRWSSEDDKHESLLSC